MMADRRDSPLVDLRTIQDRVADHLRQRVLDGVLRPGDRIHSASLAHELGTSTMPVREALHRLEAEELLVFEPYRGIFVAQVSPERIEEIYVMRAALEEFAVGLAVPGLLPGDLAAMERHLEGTVAAVDSADPAAFYAADLEFHLALCAATGRPTLVKQVRDLRSRGLRWARLYQGLPGVMARALAENRQILEACRSGDRRLAMRLTRVHILDACRRVLRQLRAREGRQGAGAPVAWPGPWRAGPSP